MPDRSPLPVVRKITGLRGASIRPRSSSNRVSELKARIKAKIKDDLSLRRGKSSWCSQVIFSRSLDQVLGCGRDHVALCIIPGCIFFIGMQQAQSPNISFTNALLSPSRVMRRGAVQRSGSVATAATDASYIQPGQWVVKCKIDLGDVKFIVETEANSRTIALDVRPASKPPPWKYSVVVFHEEEHKEDFLAYALNEMERLGIEVAMATVPEDLLSVDHGKRAISSIRLRRALDDKHNERLDRTEDDYCEMASNPHVAELLRSHGDTTVHLSVEVEVLKSRGDEGSKYPHVLLFTESSIFIFHKLDKEYRFERRVRVDSIEAMIQEKGAQQNLLLLQLTSPSSIKSTIHGDCDIVIRAGGKCCMPVCRATDPSGELLAIRKIREHLERIYLEVKIEKLPLRVERDVWSRSRSRIELAVQAGSRLVSKLLQPKKRYAHDPTGEKEPAEMALKWLLWVVKNRMFDLIFTFSTLTSTERRELPARRWSPSHLGSDNLTGRRLGLSLLALCDYCGLTHQLVYDAVLYEVQIARPVLSLMFQHESFASRILALFLGRRADQYVRLVLTDVVAMITNTGSLPEPSDRSAVRSEMEHWCDTFLEAMVKTDVVQAAPHELSVVVAVISKCCREISHLGNGSRVDDMRAVGAFLMQRLWSPAIMAPEACGLVARTSGEGSDRRAWYLSGVAGALHSALGFHSLEVDYSFMDEWVKRNQMTCRAYVASLLDRSVAADLETTVCGVDQEASDNEDDATLSFTRRDSNESTPSGLRRRASLMNPEMTMSRVKTLRPRDHRLSFNHTKDQVNSFTDEEIGVLRNHLYMVHESLSRDTERLLVCLFMNQSSLKRQIANVKQAIENETNSDLSELLETHGDIMEGSGSIERQWRKSLEQQRLLELEQNIKASGVFMAVLSAAVAGAVATEEIQYRLVVSEHLDDEIACLENILPARKREVEELEREVESLRGELAKLMLETPRSRVAAQAVEEERRASIDAYAALQGVLSATVPTPEPIVLTPPPENIQPASTPRQTDTISQRRPALLEAPSVSKYVVRTPPWDDTSSDASTIDDERLLQAFACTDLDDGMYWRRDLLTTLPSDGDLSDGESEYSTSFLGDPAEYAP